MKRTYGIIALLAVISAGLTVPAFAGEGDVVMGGVTILRVRFPVPGMSVRQRADAITQRITDLVGGRTIKPEDIQVTTINKEVALTVAGQLLITVDKPTADFNKATPQQLGEMWARHLRDVLPGLTTRKNGQEGL